MAMTTYEATAILTTMRDAMQGKADGYRARNLLAHAAVYEEEARALTTVLDVVHRLTMELDQLPIARTPARHVGVRT